MFEFGSQRNRIVEDENPTEPIPIVRPTIVGYGEQPAKLLPFGSETDYWKPGAAESSSREEALEAVENAHRFLGKVTLGGAAAAGAAALVLTILGVGGTTGTKYLPSQLKPKKPPVSSEEFPPVDDSTRSFEITDPSTPAPSPELAESERPESVPTLVSLTPELSTVPERTSAPPTTSTTEEESTAVPTSSETTSAPPPSSSVAESSPPSDAVPPSGVSGS